jgi:hypothetical protein
MTAHGWRGKKLKTENPRLYALCKAERLGLGYGCGPDKFVTVARILGGLEVSLDESKRIVSGVPPQQPRHHRALETAGEGVP